MNAANEANFIDERFAAIRDQAVREMERLPVPGVVVGVYHAGREFFSGLGVTSVEHPLPVTANTYFQIGSITKTFVATAAMRLVEMGKLDLDEPVRAYFPELKLADESTAARVTMRHLLTHTGGWVGDYFNDFGRGEDALAKMVAHLVDLPQITPLGQVWSYNNAGFYIAGRVFEILLGASFETLMQDLVLDPLGLKETFFFADDVITHRVAIGHEVVDRKPRVARPWAIGRAVHPAGGILCTLPDLLRYARFHMGDGRNADGVQILSAAALAQMQTPLVPSSGINSIGLSWSITLVDGVKMISHGGGTNGQTVFLRVVPEKQFAVGVLTNSDEGDNLYNGLVNTATQTYLGLSVSEAVPLDLAEEELSAYVGRYEATADLCEIRLDEVGLVAQVTPKGGFPTPDSPPSPPPPPVRAGLYAPDRLILLDEPLKGARGEFLRNPDGSIAWMRLFGRIHARI